MSERTHAWPTLDHDELAPMVGYVNRVVQVAGKYTLDAPFEVGWGNTVLDVTPRGLRTPTFRQPGVAFTVHYRLLDGDVVIEADTGSRTVSLAKGSVASFFEEFCDAAAELGVDRPRTTLVCEIPDCAPTFQGDRAERTWDHRAARLMWEAWNIAACGMEAWQAPFRGNHPRVGVMWGGFDLSATRHSTRPTEPPPGRPAFQRNAQLSAYVAVGFAFGDASAPPAGMYAYIWPAPDGLEGRSWGVEGAAWHPDAGLVLLPWDRLGETADPHRSIVAFGDAVYQAAVDLAGWPADSVGPRVDGWYMSRTPPERVRAAEKAHRH
ncbi:hypothetical protein STAN_4079 [Streptomyces sp. CBMAI 2042]|uniref:DUF5996 family protein n=1 Tax=Streptomyces sp. CBMAI 2042 TaxID=2305222 RepID=UPI000F1C323F|nr:DUF5996 family protein [Streptomyces sp. CBMAI 2042]RLV68555.1 hypothetical protein STAN_4079 [Streptomyces sp. CBMAI 2042]